MASRRPLLLALAACLSLLPGCVRALGGPSHALLSKAEERKLGRKVVEQVRERFAFLEDPYVTAYLTDMGARLAEAMGASEFEMEFHVVADPRLNAFAVPGGHVFVTSQTVLAVGDESELAGVVAHEMGHVEGRHMVHRMEKASRVNLAAVAAVLAGVVLGGNPELAGAATAFGVAGAQAKMLQYSRTDEEDADRRALRAVLAGGYDGWGLVRFMETLHREAPAPEGIPAYLFTHPLPENRASYLAAALPPPEAGARSAGPGRLWRIQARVLVEDPRPWGLEFARERVRAHPQSADAHLALGLLLRARGRYDEALAHLDRAAGLAPGDAEVLHEAAVTRIRKGLVEEGVKELESLRVQGEAGEAVLRDLGWAYLEAGRAEAALSVYDELAGRGSSWERLDYYRGLALGRAGREGEGHAALGDYYRRAGRPELAARHYRAALKSLDGEARRRVEQALRGLEESRKPR
ncbi:MAG: hypothetical protein Kow0092_07190 [Deferrisomatales bacterium]